MRSLITLLGYTFSPLLLFLSWRILKGFAYTYLQIYKSVSKHTFKWPFNLFYSQTIFFCHLVVTGQWLDVYWLATVAFLEWWGLFSLSHHNNIIWTHTHTQEYISTQTCDLSCDSCRTLSNRVVCVGTSRSPIFLELSKKKKEGFIARRASRHAEQRRHVPSCWWGPWRKTNADKEADVSWQL